jgi:NHL repeat
MRMRWIVAAGGALFAMTLAGCGSGSAVTMTQNPITPTVTGPHGEAYGGQQPVTGMSLQLYAAGSGGYGTAAATVFSTPVTTDSNGDFSFPSGWSCPAGNPNVYLVGTGGDPVAGNTGGNTSANPNLALMVALGPCNSLTSSTHIHMNELTTVAAVWALAPFMAGNTTSYADIGTTSTNATGLQLAFEAASEVVNTSTGTFPGTLPSGATLPTDELNTLADVLEACINSKGGAAGDGSDCGKLFSDAPSGTGNPTDTITAAMNIAQNPVRNVTALYDLASPTPAFAPALGSAPNAWTVAIQYSGGGLNAPTAIAADQSGNIWVTNSGSDAVSWFDNLGNSKLGTTGTVLSGIPEGVAIDLSGNAWVTASDSSLYELSSSAGSILSAIGSGQTGFNGPTGVAIDPAGEIWVVNSGNDTVSAVNGSGTSLTGSPFSGAGISAPSAIAVNGNANAN